MKLSYLGPEGSFSHGAALEVLSRLQVTSPPTPCPNAEAIVRSVASSDPAGGTLGLVPYYNFLEGLVQEHLDLIYEYHLRIQAMVRLPVEFCAGSFEEPSDAREVLSHPKALPQVSDFIHRRLPSATLSPVSSTSEAARLVGETRRGVAIAPEAALRKFAVPIFARNVGNLRHGKANFTDFFVVSRSDAPRCAAFGVPTHALLAITPNVDRPGLLAELLGQFHFYGLDIAKIHSRPAIDSVARADEPQMFYLEIKCAPDAEPLMRCAEAIRYRFGGKEPSRELLRVMGGFGI